MPVQESTPLGAPTWVELSTSDTTTAQAFYAALFGWTYEVGSDENNNYITCSRNGSRVAGMMQNAEDSGQPDGWATYFASSDAQATADLADDSGGQAAAAPMDVPGMGTMASLIDPGGATVGVWQAAGHDGFELIRETGAPLWHELHTRHYRASVLFYETVLGWSMKELSDTDEFRYATADFDGQARVGVWDATTHLSEDTPAHWEVYFAVDDVDATVASAETNGGSIIEPAQDSSRGRLATLADPTGARFTVMTPAASGS